MRRPRKLSDLEVGCDYGTFVDSVWLVGVFVGRFRTELIIWNAGHRKIL